jgi:hypothetical protein
MPKNMGACVWKPASSISMRHSFLHDTNRDGLVQGSVMTYEKSAVRSLGTSCQEILRNGLSCCFRQRKDICAA